MAVATASRGRRHPVYRITRVLTWLVYAFAVTAIAFLATAFFLRLFDANTSAPFVQWVYRATRILMQPFRGIFPAIEGESGSVFDASLLFAMFMYGMLAMGMHALLDWIARRMAAAERAELAEIAAARLQVQPGASPEAPAVAKVDEAPAPYLTIPDSPAPTGPPVRPQP